MQILIIIPAYNEEKSLKLSLDSLTHQTVLPKKVIIVNDNSTDTTENIIDEFSRNFAFIQKVTTQEKSEHIPGAKVVQAFYKGLSKAQLNEYDIVCKFDADIIFPENYLEEISAAYKNNKYLGMCSGLCYIESKDGIWVYEPIADKDHTRGPIKSYSVECFNKMNGLRTSIGWDTVDELLAHYHNFETKTLKDLKVKHLRPTGNSYNKKAIRMQGEAMYKIRYGIIITVIASLKMALKKRSYSVFYNNIAGYLEHSIKKTPYIVTNEEGVFIRKYRYAGILKKLTGKH
ncbi:glycosyl transferase family 2 [Neptunitalea chrysea]|uniref:Glycosyl transferase family 2 n=1 Tax=Neptunitalea chrysea TaxID=1647581 RepID=A0A9W6B883_9FLAO|nr:glycosyltransferase family 2 protein [Neptunitalea chrysea]GLB53292.1 glycosyl transferase family 2 [Neptunitalea chrysea]